MSNINIGEVIAERYFQLQDEAGVRSEVVLRIGKPLPDPKAGGDWCCPYQIVGFGDDKVTAVFGVDPMQALLFGLQKAWFELHYYQKIHKRKLTWLGEDDLGLPPLIQSTGTQVNE